MANFTRRSVLKSIAMGTASLSFVGFATAGGRSRYLVSGRGRGLGRRIEREGYDIEHTLADGRVLVVHGPSGATGDLQRVRGVQQAALDALFRLERPERVEPFDETTDEEFYSLQWDKQNTEVASAHERATGAGRAIAVIDTGVEVGHADLPNRTGAEETRNGLPTEVEFHDEFDADGNIVTTVRAGDGEVTRPTLRWFEGSNEVFDHECNFVGYDPAILQAPADLPVGIDVVDHGTHVAGIAAGDRTADGSDAPEEDSGIVGTAPDAAVVPIRVFNWVTEEVDADGDGEPETEVANILASFAGIFLGIDYASRLGVDAMNLSIGTAPLPPQINAGGIRGIGEQVVQTATARGSLVVVSAGNSNANLQQGGFFTLPNSLAGAMSISATGPNDLRTFYSNFGTNEIDVGAPGGGYDTLPKTLAAPFLWESIYGPDDDDEPEIDHDDDPATPDVDVGFEYPTFEAVEDSCSEALAELVNIDPVDKPYPTNLVLSSVPSAFWGADYAFFAGTSMAAPQVTGTAALVREVAPDANASQVEKAIEQGAEAIEGESRAELGAGRLNCANALGSPAIK